MSGVKVAGLRTTVPATAITVAGNSAVFQSPLGAAAMMVSPNVSAYTSGTATYEIQWSNDGTNFFSADPKDAFTGIAGVLQVFKYVTVKAPFYRIAWTGTPVLTHAFADHPLSYSIVSPTSYEQGSPSLAPPVSGAIGSTTLSATYVQGTPATMSAITAVPTNASRLSVLLRCTANTWTTGVFEIVWSLTGVAGSTWHSDPTDVFATFAGASTVFKEVPVKAPFYALTIASGTPGSATFTVDVGATAL